MNPWSKYKIAMARVSKQQDKISRLKILIRDADMIFETIETTNLFDQDRSIKQWRDGVKKEMSE